MIQDVLIEVQDDLASRIALRYACQMEKSIPFILHALHVPDLEKYGRTPGDGWVKKKWEEVVVENSGDKITRMIKREFPFCYSDSDPRIVSGEREQVIFDELNRKTYDFFIEGLLHSFEPDEFFEKLSSRLYQKLPCPALLVKNLAPPDAGVLIIGTPEKIPIGLTWLSALLDKVPGDLNILVCHFEPSVNGGDLLEADPGIISGIVDAFLEQAKEAGRVRAVKGSPARMAGLVRDYALVISFVPESRDPLAHLLAMCPGSILFCPEREIEQT